MLSLYRLRPFHLLLSIGLLWLLLAACGGGSETAVSPPPLPADVALDGSLTFTRWQDGQQTLLRWDLTTGSLTTLFTVPEGAWLGQTAVSPDGNLIAMTYAPPLEAGAMQLGDSDLFQMAATPGAVPQPLFTASIPGETFQSPTWSVDGRFLYYVHVIPDPVDVYAAQARIERWQPQTGNVELVVASGLWPRLSADGTQLAYVTATADADAYALWLANADGGSPRQLVTEGTFLAIDAPLFAPDGAWLYFSAVPLATAAVPWWQVPTAAAHMNPSDWWRVPTSGGDPQQITHVQLAQLYGDFAGNGRYFAFASSAGLYLAQADGGAVWSLLTATATDSLSWRE
ncbi:MAG: PD40 domain-containing protein [Anaerolineales bacterium]|nr:PD40 domain-containing protein [Anaerolineales bacterium]